MNPPSRAASNQPRVSPVATICTGCCGCCALLLARCAGAGPRPRPRRWPSSASVVLMASPVAASLRSPLVAVAAIIPIAAVAAIVAVAAIGAVAALVCARSPRSRRPAASGRRHCAAAGILLRARCRCPRRRHRRSSRAGAAGVTRGAMTAAADGCRRRFGDARSIAGGWSARGGDAGAVLIACVPRLSAVAFVAIRIVASLSRRPGCSDVDHVRAEVGVDVRSCTCWVKR